MHANRLVFALVGMLLLAACSGDKPRSDAPRGILKHASFSFQIEDTNPNSKAEPKEVLSLGIKIRLEKKVHFSNADLMNAEIKQDAETGLRELWIYFRPEATAALAAVTGANIGKRLAILIDGQIWIAPIIKSEVKEGKAIITGSTIQSLMDKLVKHFKEDTK